MPLHTLVVPYGQFRGAIRNILGSTGLVLFDTPKAGNVSRQYVIPDNPQSTHQTALRGYLTLAAAAFKALTAVKAAQWNAAAALLQRTNPLGIDYELSGIGLAVMINSYRLMNGQAQVDVPPATDLPITPESVTVTTSAPGADLSVEVTCSGNSDGDLMLVRVSNVLPGTARQARPNDVRLASDTFTECFGVVSSGSATLSITDDLFNIDIGDSIGVDVMPLTSVYMPGRSLFTGNLEVGA